MKKIKLKNYFLLFILIIFNIQFFLLTSCQNKSNDQKQEISDKSIILLNKIKKEINTEFEQTESSVLDYNSFKLSEFKLFNILTDAYEKMTSGQVELFSSEISEYFISKINLQLKVLNTKLKREIDILTNLSFDIVTIDNSNLFLEKLDYKQLIDIIKQLNKGTISYFSMQNNDVNPTIFKIKLNLIFKIRIDNIHEESYSSPALQHFITDNVKDISSKLGNISDSLYPKLEEIKLDLEAMLTNQGVLIKNLDQKLMENIKTNFNKKNPELILNFTELSTLINEQDLKIELKSLKHTDENGNPTNEGVEYYKQFINAIIKQKENMIKSSYIDNDELKKINSNRLPSSGKINVKEFKYTPLNLSINDINIPMVKPIKTFLTLEYENFEKYLEQFRIFLNEYFQLINAGEIKTISDASRKIVTINWNSMTDDIWINGPVKALEQDFKQVIFPKMKDKNKQYFKMIFDGTGGPKHKENGVHWYNLTLKFAFKIFSINFLDEEQIKFNYNNQ